MVNFCPLLGEKQFSLHFQHLLCLVFSKSIRCNKAKTSSAHAFLFQAFFDCMKTA